MRPSSMAVSISVDEISSTVRLIPGWLAANRPRSGGIRATLRIGTTPTCSAPRNWPGSLVQFLQEIFQVPENGAGVLLENLAGRSEQDAFSASLKKRNAQAGFEVAHLLGDTRLRNPEAIRRAAEAAGFRDRQEIAEVADFHRVVHRGGILSGPVRKCNKGALLPLKIMLP